ncbi:MAG: CPBP family intramembrane metalloprotease [Silicimonas sp.]|jgi:hypothetical protein|nr:CPBP family intramembrane metalloprotease [Silicimonas sp.]
MSESRISWLERENDDFPYYDGQPVPVTGVQWVIVVASVALGFYVLFQLQLMFPTGPLSFLSSIAFVAIMLGTLALFTGRHWTALFRRMRGVDWLLILLFFVLNWIVTIAAGFLVVAVFDAQPNPAGKILAAASQLDKYLFFGKSAVQLLGEELLTVLPFLAVLTWLVAAGVSRTVAIVIAALVASTIFAMVHLPTYQWNWGHCLVALIPVRLVLLLPYIMTKNLWVSTGVHVVNDWLIFGLPLLFASGEGA